ncbi:glycine--tRNA ligase subunit beta [Stenotrophomonas sp. Betaine-02u-21]|uniref:glycine--tRNA ligase subunit beta n=1 Tax=unclassified Stenotrophomonas TaxID=196198 RepID=UPI000C3323EA|nr:MULTISPECIES: glycine--tRNA ligase subunit beta [unclassified Stenotrophomonas]PKH73882.1 glycine--tRNA ligase subunit beta [Stenotrophomonas sp. Betaine-02u-21]PKH76314.1 glycine--tRNA ligase subunit beta [Stenotrophomonas sp. Betaine-02u-23]PKH96490.1 glycine--tRNA ligase subunit beta [Stenotrophomonas sp. Bg11-02]
MSHLSPLLIELGTEELPVKALPGLSQAFFDGIVEGLRKRGVELDLGDARPLSTPRRLAVLLPGVGTEQPEQHSEVLGPYLNIALDADGQPTKALQGFAAKAGIDWSALEKTRDGKGERFVHRAVKPGARTADLLPEVLREAIAAMPIPKPMRWGDHAWGFARPVHWLVLLHGPDIVDAELFGLKADRMTRGHRFHHDKTVWLTQPQDYVESLRSAFVLVDPQERRERIAAQVQAAAAEAGGSARITEDNLGQVVNLVEWPSAVLCSFERAFLAVPQEALIETMEINQKFFPVLDEGGRLTEKFIGIANIESRDVAEVAKGYERVIRPRFADAKFFFDEDLKQGLESMGDGLKTVTYQAKLGSVADKVARVVALADAIAPQVGADPVLARRAAQLAKNDLQSRMVNEFPELQGIAGRHYALTGGESPEVALAIDESYQPRFGGDDIALSPLGKVLAIAERLDTLAGGFAAGLKPTGNKDPFALRRNALGLARTVIESGFELDLRALLAQANTALAPRNVQADVAELYDFIIERLRGYYADKGVPASQFNAVAELKPASLYDFDRRIDAIGTFAALPEAPALAAANKRIGNILRKADIDIPGQIDPSLLREEAERALAEAVAAAIDDTGASLQKKDYVSVLERLARLRPQVDAFFDQVMVNDEDPAVRANRLALLKRLSDRFDAVASLAQL